MSTETRDRLLDAAETLFAERGIPATSLRAVTSSAGANIAAVNYHFGSKEGLVRAVLARRLEPLNRDRLELLERYEAEAGERGPEVDQILHALVAPAFQLAVDENELFASMLVRLHFEQDEDIYGILVDSFEPVLRRFAEALQRALPDLPTEQLTWRLVFSVGAMAMTVANPHLPVRVARDMTGSPELATTIERLVTFLTAGFRTPRGR